MSSPNPCMHGCDVLWRQNPLLVRLLGLCPLLAVSTRLIDGITLTLLLMVVSLWTSGLVSGTRYLIPPEARPICHALFLATGVGMVTLLLKTFRLDMAVQLGIYVPVMAGCCLLMAHSAESAGRQSVVAGLRSGAGIAAAMAMFLIPFSAAREVLAYGTLLRDADQLLPTLSPEFTLRLWPGDEGLAVAALPPGALLLLGVVLALHRRLTPPPTAERPV
ncbi:MAG TPA: Rnf-Nqr domain containing protein [Gammaproteobacteria bacterium]|nr:Rnf-Nqr domain containing protein [Gammaproteobacteria bacterium]